MTDAWAPAPTAAPPSLVTWGCQRPLRLTSGSSGVRDGKLVAQVFARDPSAESEAFTKRGAAPQPSQCS